MPRKSRAAPTVRNDLEIVPVVYEGEEGFLIRDALGLIERPVIIQRDALAVLGLLDGRRTALDIQIEIVRRKGGEFLGAGQIEKLLDDLDAARVLDTPRFRRARKKLVDDYARATVREACLAGESYPSGEPALRGYLRFLLEGAEGPGPAVDPKKICALVAPHIELETGKKVFARAYASLRGLSPATIVLLGTGHSLQDGHYALTDKDFETPFGRVGTDRGAVAALREAGGEAVAPSDIAHRREHSLEFQLVFLQYLFGRDFSIVPILCGSFHRELGRVDRPSDIPGVGGFLAALREIVRGGGTGVLCVAGVDFSHVGPKFGHAEDAASLIAAAKKHDGALIDAACRGDLAGFWAESKRTGDRTNVCGFSALASLLEILPGARGIPLDYEVWREEPTRSAVSYAAIVFERA
jgi:AmmeMemoRadiSam system protein B